MWRWLWWGRRAVDQGNAQAHQQQADDYARRDGIAEEQVAGDDADHGRDETEDGEFAGRIALQEGGEQNKAKPGDDQALVEHAAQDARIEVEGGAGFEQGTEEKKNGQAGQSLPEQCFDRVHGLREALGVNLPGAQEDGAGQDQEIAGQVLEVAQGNAFGKDEHNAGKSEGHAADFGRADAVAGNEKMGKQGGEEGVGGDEDGGSTGEGMGRADVEQINLGNKNEYETGDAFALVSVQG